MKNIVRRSLFVCAVIVFCVLPTALPTAGPDDDLIPRSELVPPYDKIIVLDCSHGWTAYASGEYGGVKFGLSCRNTKDKVKIYGTVGTAYDILVRGEGPVGVRCTLTGDSPTVDATCNEAAHLTIR